MRVKVVMVVSMIFFSSYASGFVRDQLYACAGAAIRSALAVGTGYAVGRLFGHEHAGACAGALAVVAGKEYPHGLVREVGYCAPIALFGWYCYANMRNKVQDAQTLGQSEERLRKCDVVLQHLRQNDDRIKDSLKELYNECSDQLRAVESSSRLCRSNSCPHLVQNRNSFGQIAMNELY